MNRIVIVDMLFGGALNKRMKVYVTIAFLSALVSGEWMAEEEECDLNAVDRYFDSVLHIHLPTNIDEARTFCSKSKKVIEELLANQHLCRINKKVTQGLNHTMKKVDRMHLRYCEDEKGLAEFVKLVKCFAGIQFDETLKIIRIKQVAAFEKASTYPISKLRLGLCAATIKALEEKNNYLTEKCGKENSDNLRKVYLSLHNKRMCGTRSSKELFDRLGGEEQEELEAIYSSNRLPKTEFKTLAPTLMRLLQKVTKK